jgi:hypothetical protein
MKTDHWHNSQSIHHFELHLTNGSMEGLNNKIQGLIKKAYG